MKQGDEPVPRSLIKLHKKHIKGTSQGEIVKEYTLYVCNMTNAVKLGCGIPATKIYITSKVMKHIYDKRPAFEYDFLIQNLPMLVKYPEYVHRNSSSKRGSYCFVKTVEGVMYMVSVEESIEDGETCLFVVTGFRTEEKYLKKFPILWSWRDGIPSS